MADGKLQGSVIDMITMAPIAGAQVTTDPGGHNASTGDDGNWGPIDVAGGTHDVTVTKEHYRDGIYQGIYVLEGDTTELKFGLQPDYE